MDIPNTLDSIWEIDIKKSSASLPDVIKRNLVAVVQNSVGRSESVYRYRGRKVSNDNLQHVWNTVDNRGQFHYLVNRELPLYKLLESSLDETALDFSPFTIISQTPEKPVCIFSFVAASASAHKLKLLFLVPHFHKALCIFP